jgi:diguanylate cyclase (GGDEF)-like protein/PAS domain S-box-containing protein
VATQRKKTESARSKAYLRFRQRLVGGLLTMALIAIAVVAWQFHSSYIERETGLRRQTQHFARAMEAHVMYAIQYADLSLIGFGNAIKVLPDEKRTSVATLRTLLSSRSSAFTHDFWISYIDAEGKGVAASNDLPIAGVDYTDRAYFSVHKNSTTPHELYIDGPMIGRISKQKLFYLSRRVESDDGRFLGVIVAPLDATRFAAVFENSRITDDVSITLLHRNGRIIARAPNFEAAFNSDLSKGDLFTSLQRSPTGTYRTFSSFDGVSRMFSYRALDNFPLIIAVGGNDPDGIWFSSTTFIVGSAGLLLLLLLMLASGKFALASYTKLEERELRYRQLYVSSREMEEKLSASEERLRLIADNLPIMITYVDNDERYTFTNQRFDDVFQLAPQEAVGRKVEETIGPAAYALSQPRLHTALTGQIVYFERPLLTRGGLRWDGVTYVPDYDGAGQVRGLFVMAEDITARRTGEESMKLAGLMYQNSSEGMMVTDADGKILSVNSAFSRISGYTEEEVTGHRAYELTSGRQDLEFFRKMQGALRHSGRWEGEVWHQHKSGEHYLVSLRFNAVFDENGDAYRRVALFSDITKKKATEELIWKQANFDTLTGLPNRRMFQERLRQEMKKADRVHLPMALVFIDLDGFKAVNDKLGHAMGDVLLKEVASRLSHCVRSTDTVSRLGGDEFTVILGELKDSADVMRIAQQILAATASPFQLGNEIVRISASIGITLYPEDGQDAEILVKNADQAMYAAKQEGRNRYNYFAPFMQEENHSRLALAGELRDAVAGGQMRVLYQPIIELASGRVCKAEALVRWQHPTRGLIGPAEFLAVAEHTGALVGIGDWVFQQAARQVQRIQQLHDSQFQVSVNNAACQFREGGCHVGAWVEFLEELGLAAGSVIIEVTESVLLDGNLETTRKLAAFHEAKIQLSLDDFGTGYCSVAFLKRYNLDYLKIDPTYIANLAGGSDGMALCEAIIALAHKLGIQVIAEGIETAQQMAALTDAGCDFGQGYLVSRPITGEELESLLSPVDKPMDIHRTTCE